MTADVLIAPLEVSEFDESRLAEWDAFVYAQPEATFFHLSGWKQVIETSFGHDCYYLYAHADGRVVGILPLVHIKSRLLGNALISTAFCVYGGPVGIDEPARSVLEYRAVELAHELNVDYLEFRRRAPGKPGWVRNDELYATFRKELDPDPEANLKQVPRKQRAMVRKGIKGGLKSRSDAHIDDFFALYGESVRNLGTPVFGKKYFANLKSVFDDACEILTITDGDTPVSSVMNFYFRDEVLPYYGGGGPLARKLAANDFMYWEVMRRACENGYRVFDFGRSKRGTGSFAFKTHWGFAPEPLSYEYKLFGRDDIPSVNPTNPKYHMAIRCWKRLPLAIANRLGPMIAKDLG
jgi:FemAB-related protein (PEP-CTERM system-associated)